MPEAPNIPELPGTDFPVKFKGDGIELYDEENDEAWIQYEPGNADTIFVEDHA